MQQYFIENEISKHILFNEEQAHHIKNVMRMKEGNVVKVVDSNEHAALVSIYYENKNVFGNLVEMCQTNTESNINITLGMCLIKKDKWDFCIQKVCECGVYDIMPILSSRCVVKSNDEKESKKLVRWQKIASEACEQSKRNHCSTIHKVIDYQDIQNIDTDLKLIAYENADSIASNIAAVLSEHPSVHSIFILIGPEGGFSEEEVSYAMNLGFKCVSLGKRILRAETAAISAINMITYHYDLLGEVNG